MNARTASAICLGPTGNVQGSHYFLSLRTGHRIVRHRWTLLPTPTDVIARVNAIAKQQKMAKTITFGDRYGKAIPHGPLGVDDDHDSKYDPADDDPADIDHDSDNDSVNSDSSEDSDEPPPGAQPTGVHDALRSSTNWTMMITTKSRRMMTTTSSLRKMKTTKMVQG
jgi:hypothetical protein